MKTTSIKFFGSTLMILLGLSSCKALSLPKEGVIPLNKAFAGLWKSACTNTGSGSTTQYTKEQLSLSADGELIDSEITFSTSDCSGAPTVSSVLYGHFVVSVEGSASSIIQMDQMTLTPPDPSGKTEISNTLSLELDNSGQMTITVTDATFRLANGTIHYSTPAEVAEFQPTLYTR